MIKQEDLKKIRAELGYSQAQMAFLLHCTSKMYFNYEKMKNKLPPALSELLWYKLREQLDAKNKKDY